jgi:hypothetical protein
MLIFGNRDLVNNYILERFHRKTAYDNVNFMPKSVTAVVVFDQFCCYLQVLNLSSK